MPSIPPKPVLDSRRFGRTPAAFLTGLAACSLIAIFALVIVVAHSGPAPTLVGLLLGMLPIPLLVALILLIDRLEPEPRALLLAIFGAGAGVAVIIALLGHATGTAAIAIPELGPHAGRGVSIGAAIGAAAVAESLKGLVLLALLPSRRTEIDGATDGVVYASMIGLGFALVANVYAYAAAWEAGIRPLAEEFARRGIFGPLWEALFTSMIGLGIAYAAARKGATGYWAIGAGWVVAVALDALWSKSVTEGGASLAVTYAILVVALAVVVSLVVADWRRVVAMINSFLPQFDDPRTVTTSDLHMLTSLRIRRLGRQWARLNVGIDAMHAMTQYQLAATELAMACNRNAHGRHTPEHFARHRDDSLTLRREAVTLIRGRDQLFPPPWVGDGPSAFVRS